jgi:hypothetical protein
MAPEVTCCGRCDAGALAHTSIRAAAWGSLDRGWDATSLRTSNHAVGAIVNLLVRKMTRTTLSLDSFARAHTTIIQDVIIQSRTWAHVTGVGH